MYAIELPVAVLINLMGRERAREPHAILAGGEGYVQRWFQDEVDRIIRTELARAGVRPDGQFRDTLNLIHNAGLEYYGWIDAGAESYGALVAARGRAAVTVVRRGDRVTLRRADPDHLTRSLVSHLPDVPPARGPSISVRDKDFTPSNPGGGLMRQASGARSHDARRLDGLLREPRLGGARLYAATRDDAGRRHRSTESLTVLDVARQGRWLIYLTAGTGDRAINAVPAPPELIATKLTALRNSITKGARQ